MRSKLIRHGGRTCPPCDLLGSWLKTDIKIKIYIKVQIDAKTIPIRFLAPLLTYVLIAVSIRA